MIRKDKLNRIIRHLQTYKNTIIVPNDFKNDRLEHLLELIEKEGFKIRVLSYRDKKDSICEHWTIGIERDKDGK